MKCLGTLMLCLKVFESCRGLWVWFKVCPTCRMISPDSMNSNNLKLTKLRLLKDFIRPPKPKKIWMRLFIQDHQSPWDCAAYTLPLVRHLFDWFSQKNGRRTWTGVMTGFLVFPKLIINSLNKLEAIIDTGIGSFEGLLHPFIPLKSLIYLHITSLLCFHAFLKHKSLSPCVRATVVMTS